MAQAVRWTHPLSYLNSDGRRHPKENSLATATLVLGVVSVVCAWWSGLHVLGTWVGIVGVLTGAWGQYISATTGERFVTIIGLGAAAVGFYINMMHGGFLA
ncbi:hypothetical protein [Streptomyces sp. PU-14G]|jgi:hypothetical protein|uniref:hypothetical protein n=1 Tax=Streptomyces sp. PU-14G TaxID=2800808 RepID=UPI0034DDEDCF